MPLYTIETPKGKLVEWSVGVTISDAWNYFFDSAKSSAVDELTEKNDLNYDDAAKKLGYKAVRVYLTKQNPSPKKRGKPIKIITEYRLPDHS